MPDPISPIQRVVMLRRIDLEQGMARFYSLMIERDLFGAVRLMRHWGRIGATQGRKMARTSRPKTKLSRHWSGSQRPSGSGAMSIYEPTHQ